MQELFSPMTLAFLGNLVGPDSIVCLLVPIGLAFWIWMLVEVITKEPDGNERLIWVLVVAITHIIGALIYFFVRRPERKKKFGH